MAMRIKRERRVIAHRTVWRGDDLLVYQFEQSAEADETLYAVFDSTRSLADRQALAVHFNHFTFGSSSATAY
jgi:hypothetical protein